MLDNVGPFFSPKRSFSSLPSSFTFDLSVLDLPESQTATPALLLQNRCATFALRTLALQKAEEAEQRRFEKTESVVFCDR